MMILGNQTYVFTEKAKCRWQFTQNPSKHGRIMKTRGSRYEAFYISGSAWGCTINDLQKMVETWEWCFPSNHETWAEMYPRLRLQAHTLSGWSYTAKYHLGMGTKS